jgi:hypothetical protein
MATTASRRISAMALAVPQFPPETRAWFRAFRWVGHNAREIEIDEESTSIGDLI